MQTWAKYWLAYRQEQTNKVNMRLLLNSPAKGFSCETQGAQLM